VKWGYYVLSGKRHLVRRRLRRHALAQDKWKIVKRVAPFLSAMPFIRGLAGSGSLAIDNTKPSSDLDIFVIAHRGRIWTARLLLLVVSQIAGRRRRYWNVKAPDMFCLNHYLTDDRLSISKEIRSVYSAVSYSSLVPVFGDDVVRGFQKANASWVRRFVMSPEGICTSHRYTAVMPEWVLRVKGHVEQFLLEPIGDVVEVAAERIQRAVIGRHWDENRSGRVVLSNHELAFHPDTKAPAIVSAYHQDPGQKVLL
jgi:predicted nucleotidyltransferase